MDEIITFIILILIVFPLTIQKNSNGSGVHVKTPLVEGRVKSNFKMVTSERTAPPPPAPQKPKKKKDKKKKDKKKKNKKKK